jgi:uncharacterized delta-60 repeat protein
MVRRRWQSQAIGWAVAALMPFAAALAADGDLDPGFGEGGIATITPDGTNTIALVPMRALAFADGKLLFSGAHHYLPPKNPPFEPEVRGMLMRMNADGSPDASFGNSDTPGVVVLPDLVAGTRIQSLDAMVRLEDGSIVGAGTGVADAPSQGFIVKLAPDGSLDAAFGSGGTVLLPDINLHAVAVDEERRIVACGERLLDHVYTSMVVRVNANGTPDAGFGDGGVVSIAWSDPAEAGYLSDLAIASDGGIIVGGRFAAYGLGLSSDFAIAKLAGDGTLDATFGDGGWRVFHDESSPSTTNAIERLALLADGRIVFAGYHASDDAGHRGAALGRLAPDGSTDATFGDAATPGYLYVDWVPDSPALDVSALALAADGKPVVALAYFSSSESERFVAFRATADGALDTGFADQGVFALALGPEGMPTDARSMTVQADGNIVLAGRATQTLDPPLSTMNVVRLLGTAAPDERIFADGFDG